MWKKKILRQSLDRLLTERATQVLDLAKREAVAHRHSYVATEHLLLGLMQLNAGVAVHALAELGIQPERVRSNLEQYIRIGATTFTDDILFASDAERALELARLEAFEIGHNYIGTEHLLLGFIREGQGIAARVLMGLGADLSETRQQIISVLCKPKPVGWT